jgi:hypothetical protein
LVKILKVISLHKKTQNRVLVYSRKKGKVKEDQKKTPAVVKQMMSGDMHTCYLVKTMLTVKEEEKVVLLIYSRKKGKVVFFYSHIS